MKRTQVIQELCGIVGMVYRSIGDYSHPSDGFCDKCIENHPGWNFQHDGITIEYVRKAVLAQLKRDGYAINEGWDPETGIEKEVTK